MISVPGVTRQRQGSAMLFAYLAFSAVYVGCSTLHPLAPTLLQGGALDFAVPYLDWSVWIYLTQFLLLPTAIVGARDDLDRSHCLYAMLFATALAAIVFLAWPTQITRPTPPSEGLTAAAWRLLYAADTPANCFPSLHVALAAIAGRALWRRGSVVAAVGWPGLIALSTLTTRQHVAWDIVGALLCAAAALWLTPRMLRLEFPQPADDPASS
jgi:hypothetical protein